MSGDREVQRTMLELLNQLDGFSSDDRIKVSLYFYVFNLPFAMKHQEHLKGVEFCYILVFGFMTFLA